MTGTYIINQICNNNYNGGVLVENYSCSYQINYDAFKTSDFIFYAVILPIVGIYLFFKFIRIVIDLFFN